MSTEGSWRADLFGLDRRSREHERSARPSGPITVRSKCRCSGPGARSASSRPPRPVERIGATT